MRIKICVVSSLAIFLLNDGGGYAQGPQKSSATYDDWTASCVMVSGAVGQQSCEVVQAQKLQGQPSPTTEIIIGRPNKSEPYKMAIFVPPNVWLQSGVGFVAGDKDAPVTATFKWCTSSRCLAEADLREDTIQALRSLSEPGRLEFKEASQRDVSMPVSFKGFGQALDEIAKH
jgi:invasion protein IalB